VSLLFSFRLSEDFVATYADKKAPFGYRDAGGNSVGEITFLRTYSRIKEDGTKETWTDVCERVINGMYSLQKDHCKTNRLPWNDQKAQSSAKEGFDRLFNLKWTPPGRGLWVMGTRLVNEQRNSAALQNCAFVSSMEMTKNNPAKPFAYLMEASMLGVGVGFDNKGADKNFNIYNPLEESVVYEIPDTREGWVESLTMQINSYLKSDQKSVKFDYSLIRPAGVPIKIFGGTAAGHQPLEKLHNHITKLFSGRGGEMVTRTDIANIGNMIGVCVVSGNVRRSAELLIGSIDDEEFLNLKNYGTYDDKGKFTPGPAADRQEFGWMSNNSVDVKVGEDLSPILDGVVRNGEPGVLWMDVSRAYGRLADAPNNKDHRVVGYNPCITDDSWVLTEDGPRQVRDLVGTPFVAIVDGEKYRTESDGFFLTDHDRQVFDLTTVEGHTLRITDNHQVMTQRGWVEAGNLTHEDKIVLHDHGTLSVWGGAGSEQEGYLIGQLWGDGTFNNKSAVLSVWGDHPEVKEAVFTAASTLSHRSDWQGFMEVPGRNEYRLKSASIAHLADSVGMRPGSKKITDDLEQMSSEFYVGFLRGAFDADGSVEGNLEKGVSIRLHQSDKEQLKRVQRMLLRLGIQSTVAMNRTAGEMSLPKNNGTGDYQIYATKATWRLIISAQSAHRYMDRIGFCDLEKSDKWFRINSLRSKAVYTKPFYATFKSLTPFGTASVYDVTVEKVHAFDANGLYVHNCAEQSLESFEMCTLVETYLNRHDTLEDYKRTLKFAYLYAKTVTLLPTHWEETNAIMQRNRRIGASMSGVADFADNQGLPTLRTWMDEGYGTIKYYDTIYSEWLGIRESIKTTTVKPSGTVSILAGESPGVHWTPGGKYFLRTIRFANSDPMLPLFKMANYRVEPAFESPDTTSVVYFPIASNSSRSDKEVTIFEKMALAAQAQRYWSDNSVSVTISFNAETESKHVGSVLHMYDGQMKTVSFLPQGNDTYPQMPYGQITEEEYNEYTMKLFQIDFAGVYAGMASDAIGEAFCSTDSCEVRMITDIAKEKKNA